MQDSPTSSSNRSVLEDTTISIRLAITIGGVLITGVVCALGGYYAASIEAKRVGNLLEGRLSVLESRNALYREILGFKERAFALQQLNITDQVLRELRLVGAYASEDVLGLDELKKEALRLNRLQENLNKNFGKPSYASLQQDFLALQRSTNRKIPATIDTSMLRALAMNDPILALPSPDAVRQIWRFIDLLDEYNRLILDTGPQPTVPPFSPLPQASGVRGIPLLFNFHMGEKELNPKYELVLRKRRDIKKQGEYLSELLLETRTKIEKELDKLQMH